MLARPTMQAPTHHSQPGSKLFSTPLEIRQEIYSYLIPYGLHAYLSDRGQLQLSGCVEPCVNGGMEGDERRGMEDFSPEDPVWLRRLMSSWGPHWRCEEMAQRIQYWFPGASKIDASDSNKDLTVLRVCKKMYVLHTQQHLCRTNFVCLKICGDYELHGDLCCGFRYP
jgi:hypothetical protein